MTRAGALWSVSSLRPSSSRERPARGRRVTGSIFGLPDVLGGLHADQLRHEPLSFIANDDIRAGLVGPIHRMSAVMLDDDALEFVAAYLPGVGAALRGPGRIDSGRALPDLERPGSGPRAAIATRACLEGRSQAVSRRRSFGLPLSLRSLAHRTPDRSSPAARPRFPQPPKRGTRSSGCERSCGEEGARDRLAQFGPRAVWYAGRFRLTDMDLPAYERLAWSPTLQLLSDRLYHLKIAVACRIQDAGLPAATLPLVLPAYLDEMLAGLKMTFGYDWSTTVRAAHSFSKADLDRLLDQAVRSGRLVRDQSDDQFAANP